MKYYLVCMLTLIVFGIQAQSIQGVNPQIHQQIKAAAQNIEQQVIVWRRDFHQNQELFNRKFETEKNKSEYLKKE